MGFLFLYCLIIIVKHHHWRFVKDKMGKEELIEEMIDNWIWEKYWDELEAKATKQVEKEEGFWKSICGVNQKVKDRHWKLHEELKKQLLEEETNTKSSQ